MTTLLSSLVGLFPRGFRRQFGPDMVEQLRRDQARARAHGSVSALGFALASALDLIRAALAERWRPTWTRPIRVSPRQEPGDNMYKRWNNDLRHAFRTLLRTPGFTAIAVTTLGLAIGANVGIFAVVDAVLIDPLPYPDSDRLVHIGASAPGSDLPEEFGVGMEFYVQYSEQSRLLENVAVYNSYTNTLRADDRIERVRMSSPSTSLFNTLGVAPMMGRLPVPDDEGRAALISHTLWTTWFGSDPDIVGRTIYAGGGDRTVVGVMGPEFWFPSDDTLLWLPFPPPTEDIAVGRLGVPLMGRVAPGVELETLADELDTLARRLPERFGGSARYAELMEQHRAIVRPMEVQLLGNLNRPLLVLLGAVGLVLLIACANVANLFMVRAESRIRDLAVRRALGAGRGELIRAQLSEAMVVAVLSGALAVALAWVSVPLLLRAAPPTIPHLDDVTLTPLTLAFALGVSMLAALVCGLGPAIRFSAPGLAQLRESGRGSTRRRHWGRDGLVVGQTAVALVLLIGSGLLLRSFVELRAVDPGYDTSDVFTFQIAPEGEHLRDAPSFARFHLDFMDRIGRMPGVESVGLVENVPLDEGVSAGRFLTEATADDTEGGALVSFTWAGGDYFATMGIDLLAGRAFTRADQESELGNVVVSRSAAAMLWPGEEAVGKRVRNRSDEAWETVVGVVEDVMQYGFRDTPQPLIYYSLVGQAPEPRPVTSPAYVVRTERADTIGPEIRTMVREVAPTAPMYRMYTMEGLAAGSMVQLSFTMLTLGLASTLALVLGAIGLFGVLSYVVAERTREIGVRMALGAEAARVRRMVVGQGTRLLGVGVAIGVLVALGTTRVLGTLLFGIGAVDVGTFVVMSVAMLAVGLLASYLPARRASSVDPIESLRGD